MSFVSVMRLQKRQKAPTNTKSDEELLAPFPTIPPILDPSSINNNPSLENTVVANGEDGVSDTEMFGLIGGALVVIGLIGIFIKKKIGGDRKKLSDKERSAGYKSHSSQNLIDDLNEQGKNSPIMIEYQHQFNSTSPRTYDSPLTPRSDSNDSHFGPPYVKKNLSHSKQDDLFYSPDSYRGPSLDDDSSHLIHAPNFQQKDLSYPSDSYNRSSPDGYSSPYLPKSPNIPNTPNTPNTPHTPHTPHTPPYPHDDYPSPYLPQSPPFAHNIPNTPNTPLYSPPNSYGGSQNSQSYRTSQHFQQQYFIEPTQGTLLPPKSSYQPQQYNSSPHSPHSLEDSPRSLSFSKSEPVSTNDQNSSSLMSYQDTPLVPTVVNNIISNDNSENFSVNSDVTNNEIKEIDDMIANIIQSENIRSSLPKISRISYSSFAGLLSDIVPITLTNEKSNRPDSQTSSIYSVQPIKGISKIEIASENKIPSSNLNHDHDLPQSAAMGYIEPTQSNMVIEHVNEPSSTSEVQLDKTQPITTPITTGFIQPSQSNMKIEKVDSAFRPEISASTMTGVETQTGPKPLYDIYGIKKHAEKILNTKAEKKSDLNNESNPEKVTENNETQNNEKNDGKQGEPLVRKKSVRFRTESNEEEIKVSNTKKSILINKNESSTSKSGDSKDEKENRDSNSGTYDFDISGYQDESYLT